MTIPMGVRARPWVGRAMLTSLVSIAALASGCGSGSPPKYLPGLAPLPPGATSTQIVRHAFVSLPHSSYESSTRVTLTFDDSQLPPAEAARLEANRALIDKTITAVATVKDFSDLQEVVKVNGQTIYLKAAGGTYSTSRDGVSYQTVPAGFANNLFSLVQSDVAVDGEHVTAVVPDGSYSVGGVRVERYRAQIPASLISEHANAIGTALGQSLPKGVTVGPSVLTIDVDRATGFPVRISDVSRTAMNLSSFHRPGVSGVVIINIRHVTSYSHVRSHPLKAPASG